MVRYGNYLYSIAKITRNSSLDEIGERYCLNHAHHHFVISLLGLVPPETIIIIIIIIIGVLITRT